MARFARVILPGIPYHVTHRGNRREPVFFSNDQREAYQEAFVACGKVCGDESRPRQNVRSRRG
ncbi:MAG: hypothetical protein NTX50_12125, partial [Candidatus Sumerlaeota bacterium]|nr:hypothetical protein [Candidatus Sumerlaeota bacterium]